MAIIYKKLKYPPEIESGAVRTDYINKIVTDDSDNVVEQSWIPTNTSNRDYYFTIDPACFDSDPDFWTWSMTAIADLDANDTAKIVMLQASGSASIDVRTTTFFSGALIC